MPESNNLDNAFVYLRLHSELRNFIRKQKIDLGIQQQQIDNFVLNQQTISSLVTAVQGNLHGTLRLMGDAVGLLERAHVKAHRIDSTAMLTLRECTNIYLEAIHDYRELLRPTSLNYQELAKEVERITEKTIKCGDLLIQLAGEISPAQLESKEI